MAAPSRDQDERDPDSRGESHVRAVFFLTAPVVPSLTGTSARIQAPPPQPAGGTLPRYPGQWVPGFVAGVRDGLELEGGVLDVEAPGEAGLQLVQQPGRTAVGAAGIVDHDGRGQCGQGRGDDPGVQVVQVPDVLGGQQVGAYVVQVHGLGRDLEQDPA